METDDETGGFNDAGASSVDTARDSSTRKRPRIGDDNDSSTAHGTFPTAAASHAQLKVFVKRETDVDVAVVRVGFDALVGELKNHVMAALQMNVPAAAVTLSLEGSSKILDSRRSVAEAVQTGELMEGATVIATERPPKPKFPELPKPLAFLPQQVGGEEMMVAEFDSESFKFPIFLTRTQHSGLLRFIDEGPSPRQQLLMLTGTIKSGKTAVLNTVVPGLLAAWHGSQGPVGSKRGRPITLQYSFPLGSTADDAALHFMNVVASFAQSISAPFPVVVTPTQALNTFPTELERFVKHIHDNGGELWLLLDEVQAPILASPPALAHAFTYSLKRTVELCSNYARVVATGSGMVALLNAIRIQPPNGFALWTAASHVALGKTPSTAAALAMAERIVAAYSVRWPDAAKQLITAKRLVDELALSSHNEFTTPRPALVAYLVGLMGDSKEGSPDVVLTRAVSAMLRKLVDESNRDTATALTRVVRSDRTKLYMLAAGGQPSLANTFGADSSLTELVELLSELPATGTDRGLRLLPPYGALIRSWVTPAGELSIALESNGFDLHADVRKNLKFFADPPRDCIGETEKANISRGVMKALVDNGIGVTVNNRIQIPQTPEDVQKVPVIAALLKALNDHQRQTKSPYQDSPSYEALKKIIGSRDDRKRKTFMATLGYQFLKWVRHVESHVWFDTPELVSSGLSPAVVMLVVREAVQALQAAHPRGIVIKDGILELAPGRVH